MRFHNAVQVLDVAVNDAADSLRSVKTSSRSNKPFDRTNRVDGQKRWIGELALFRQSIYDDTFATTISLSSVVELGKELLYSGIPEQVIELYSGYQDLLTELSRERNLSPEDDIMRQFQPNSRFLLLLVRSLVALSDIDDAVALIQSCARNGVEFDVDTKSLLLTDLATSSPAGLQAALQLRLSMQERGEKPTVNGAVGLLKGIHMHGLAPPRTDSSDAGDHFRLSLNKAEAIATEVLNQHISAASELPHDATCNRVSSVSNKPRVHKLMGEFLRIVFRVSYRMHSTTTARLQSVALEDRLDGDFQVRSSVEAEERIVVTLRDALSALRLYDVHFDQPVADVLMDECLRVDDETGVEVVGHKMALHGICAGTAIFNALLQRYAASGDAESAYNLVQDVMMRHEGTQPNEETWDILMQSCLVTKKGHYFGGKIMRELLDQRAENGSSASTPVQITKPVWEKFLQLQILQDAPVIPLMCDMILSDCQPDEDTVLLLSQTYASTGRTKALKAAVKLFEMQMQANDNRRKFRDSLITQQARNSDKGSMSPSRTKDAPNSYLRCLRTAAKDSRQQPLLEELVALALPTPSVKTVHCLLEILRDVAVSEDSMLAADARTDADVARLTDWSIEKALEILSKLCGKSIKPVGTASRPSAGKAEVASVDVVVSTAPISERSKQILQQHYAPDLASFTYVIEACSFCEPVTGSRLDIVLQMVKAVEGYGFQPNRRIYNALMSAFGRSGDFASALGVFQEMRSQFPLDNTMLQSFLDVSLESPSSLRQACVVLEELANDESVDLEAYSKDILMQGFSDALMLGAALETMQASCTLDAEECVTASLPVLSVMVQAARRALGTSGIAAALEFLGSAGVQPDDETTEYFTMPAASRHSTKFLMPNKEKKRSLLDMQFPAALAPDLALPLRLDRKRRKVQSERHFEQGSDQLRAQSSVLRQIVSAEAISEKLWLDASGSPFDEEHSDVSSAIFAAFDEGEAQFKSMPGATTTDAIAQEAQALSDINRILQLNQTEVEAAMQSSLGGSDILIEISEDFLRQAKPKRTPNGASVGSADHGNLPIAAGKSTASKVSVSVKPDVVVKSLLPGRETLAQAQTTVSRLSLVEAWLDDKPNAAGQTGAKSGSNNGKNVGSNANYRSVTAKRNRETSLASKSAAASKAGGKTSKSSVGKVRRGKSKSAADEKGRLKDNSKDRARLQRRQHEEEQYKVELVQSAQAIR